jgi:hypothetical protein
VEVADGFYDFSRFTFRSLSLELSYRRKWQMHFGYCFDNFGSHTQRRYTKTALETKDGGKTFVQEYEGNVTVVVRCDPKVPLDVIRVEDIVRGPNTSVHLAFECPQKKPYYK